MFRFFQTILLSLVATSSIFAEAQTKWVSVKIGIVGPASVDVLRSALEMAASRDSEGLLIILDTPGGSLESTREMVKDIMSSSIPVAVWVGPDGARAGSAGAFITMSGNFAAMAQGTNIGASHPVQHDGSNVPAGDMAKKIENDTVAFIESIAKARGRNVEVAASFVLASTSLTADEALKNEVIDLISGSPRDFLDKIDGREWEFEGQKKNVSSTNAVIEEYQYTLRQNFLQIVSNPNLFYLLFLAGIIGIGFELTHPGAIFPGVFGAICLTIALIASSVLPVSTGAGLLILCGIAFIVGEMFLPSFGVLGIGGVIAFIAGSILLVDPTNTQGLRVSMWMIIPSALTIAALGAGIGWSLFRSTKQKVSSGTNSLVGESGEVLSVDLDGELTVRVSGEIWSAAAAANNQIAVGQKVSVLRVNGLKLEVQPLG